MTRYNKVKKVIFDGFKFDSGAELERYKDLKLMQNAGEISDLRVHPRFTLQRKFYHPINGTIRAITYAADFEYRDLVNNRLVVEDVKGFRTNAYQIKRKMFLNAFRNIWFVEITDEDYPEYFHVRSRKR